jgi:hypothetical protein
MVERPDDWQYVCEARGRSVAFHIEAAEELVPLAWKRCPRSGRANTNVASFDLTYDGQIKLVDPPLEPITHAYELAKP